MKWQVIAGLTLLLLVFGCQQQHTTGGAQVSKGSKGVSLSAVHRGDRLVYAFAWTVDVPKMDTNDPSTKPTPKGIHLLYTAPDGLWFHGEKVTLPKESPVFALRKDGRVIPIPLTEAELQEVAELTRSRDKLPVVPDGPIKQKLLEPFQALAGGE